MNLSNVFKRAAKVVSENSPAILTALGVTGVVSTALLTHQADKQAFRHLTEENADGLSLGEILAPKERFKEVWHYYIPPAVVVITTGVCIIGANSISSRRNAAIISAYTLSESLLKDYREKVVEQLGEKKDRALIDAVNADYVKKNPPSEENVILVAGKSELCLDSMSGRYFQSDVETIRKAMNDINLKCINEMYASLNDFYHLLGIKPTEIGERLGWTTDNPLEVIIGATVSEDNRPCLTIGYRREPQVGYHKVW